MRWHAIHDSAGEIDALVAGPEEAPPVSVGLRPGQFISAIEAPMSDVSLDTGNAESEQHLIDLANRSRVTVDGVARLEPKRSE